MLYCVHSQSMARLLAIAAIIAVVACVAVVTVTADDANDHLTFISLGDWGFVDPYVSSSYHIPLARSLLHT
jgi:hypothetical protein